MGDEVESHYQRGLNHLLSTPSSHEPEGHASDDSLQSAMKSFMIAAKRGHADAQYNLAACYLTHDLHTTRTPDPSSAVYWLQRAAEQQHAAAQHELGLCLASGNGIRQDLSAAAALYSKAAAQGHGLAQCALAECLLRGQGVPVNTDRAQELFCAALTQGIVPDRSMGYNECLSTFPHDTAASVGWLDGEAAQRRRFEALLQIGVIDGDSLLDVGCGVGHLWDYCNCRPAGSVSVRYTGLDCHAAAVESAARRCTCAAGLEPEAEVETGCTRMAADDSGTRGRDACGDNPDRTSSAVASPRWVVGCASDLLPAAAGPGNVKPMRQYDWVLLSGTFNLGVTECEMWSTLRACLQLCRRGLGLNLLLRAGTNAPDDEGVTQQDKTGSGKVDAEKGGREDCRESAEPNLDRTDEATDEDYCAYDPDAVLRGIRGLLVELGMCGQSLDLDCSATEPATGPPCSPCIVVTPGKAYDVPYDFTVHVIL